MEFIYVQLPFRLIHILCSDEGFIEPPPKKAKMSSSKPAPPASEASVPATAPAAQVSTASSLFKLKNKLKDEETSKLAAETQMNEKDDLLRQSVLALLSNSHWLSFRLSLY
jgi:hypothetical protein